MSKRRKKKFKNPDLHHPILVDNPYPVAKHSDLFLAAIDRIKEAGGLSRAQIDELFFPEDTWHKKLFVHPEEYTSIKLPPNVGRLPGFFLPANVFSEIPTIEHLVDAEYYYGEAVDGPNFFDH
jgi:hypothetical protein